jgi:hypothetical protein
MIHLCDSFQIADDIQNPFVYVTVRPWRAKHHPENVLFFFRGRKPERRQELFGRVTETVLVGKKVLGPVGNHLCFSRLS